MRSRSLIALLKRFNKITPQPSERTKPLAVSSKVLHQPSGDNIRDLDRLILAWGEIRRFTPPTIARLHSWLRKL